MKKLMLVVSLFVCTSVFAGVTEGIQYFDEEQFDKALIEFKPEAWGNFYRGRVKNFKKQSNSA